MYQIGFSENNIVLIEINLKTILMMKEMYD